MNEKIKEARRDEQPAESDQAKQEIRTLDELELALAGGGDTITTWP